MASPETDIDNSASGYSAQWSAKGAEGPSGALKLSNLGTKATIVCKMDGSTTSTVGFSVWGYRHKGDAELICTATVSGGAATTNAAADEIWGDVFTVTSNTWFEDMSARGVTDQIGRLTFNTHGLEYITARITAGTAATNATLLITQHGVS